jgi:hypothetical protein
LFKTCTDEEEEKKKMKKGSIKEDMHACRVRRQDE